MTIKIGDNPQGLKWVNKYIETNGDGWRGVIKAFNKDHTEAIIIGDSRPSKLILVKEYNPEQYPFVVRIVEKIPKGFKLVKVPE